MDDPWATGRSASRHELPRGLTAAAYVRERQLAQAPTYRMVATLHAPLEYVARRAGDGLSEIETIDMDRCRITSEGDTLEWLAIRLILLDCDFEIHEPPELGVYIRTLGERLRRTAGGFAPGPAARG